MIAKVATRRPSQPLAMKIFYRISDHSYVKPRFGDKRRCLANFLRVFAPRPAELTVIADRCGELTVRMIRDMFDAACAGASAAIGDIICATEFGNGAASWRHAAELAKASPDAEIVYFLEDDYLHLPGSRPLLHEGLTIAHYCTLYDHPDKYVNREMGGNPLVEHGGEVTRVVRTPGSHWRYTNSTTMTFATTVRTLKEDFCVWDHHTRGSHPNDFLAFLDLAQRRRVLAVSIPGRATHCDPKWPGPYVNWELVQ